MSFFAELKRRNVFRVGIAYGITAWIILQIIDVVAPLLELPAWAPKLVLVILAVGFFPAVIFAWAFELTPEGLKPEKKVDRSHSITRTTARKLDRMIIATLAVAVVLLLTDRLMLAPASGPAALDTDEKSIAVLPFINMSSDVEQEYFSDGITEEILNSLAAVKRLKVAGRTSSFAFKGQNDDLRKIGDMLGVEHILEGSVRKAGTKVRITAQLIQVADGFHLWSETYDRELDDVFAIQEEIATEILKQLEATLLADEEDGLQAQRTEPQVYDLYLLARQRIYQRDRQSIESAAGLLDEAIALDPQYAPALAQRGIVALLLSEDSYGTLPAAEAERTARRYLDEALEIDAGLAEAWAGLGLYHVNQPSGHEEAIEALSRSLELNPGNIDASNWLYNVFAEIGDVKNAVALIETMIERDPLYRPAFGNGVVMFNNIGQTAKAQALIDRFSAHEADGPQVLQSRAMHALYQGDAAAALQLAEAALTRAPTDSVTRWVVTVALQEVSEVQRLAEEGMLGVQTDALDALGRRDEALSLAYKLEQEGDLAPLFTLLNRAGRSNDLTDHIEERWPSLASFAADHPHGTFGHELMLQLALAYARQGDDERAAEALSFAEEAKARLMAQGVDNWVYLLNNARFHALAGSRDEALASLEKAVSRGMQVLAPLDRADPILALLREEPEFVRIEAMMVDNINADRAQLDLAPIEPHLQFWQE